MAGFPDGEFDVTDLTVTPQIVQQSVPDLFDLSATFDGSGVAWDLVEFNSDTGGDNIEAIVTWFLESIGPGPEIVIAETTELLTEVPGGPYTASVNNVDPTDAFTQPDGTDANIEPGVYRLQCKVDIGPVGPAFYTGFFSGDVLFRVA